jgi:hypothetical protein
MKKRIQILDYVKRFESFITPKEIASEVHDVSSDTTRTQPPFCVLNVETPGLGNDGTARKGGSKIDTINRPTINPPNTHIRDNIY